MRKNNSPPINTWPNGPDLIGISLIAISTFAMSKFTSPLDSRFSDSRWLLSYTSPSELSSRSTWPSLRDHNLMSLYRDFDVLHVHFSFHLSIHIPIRETLTWSKINGLDHSLIWRLRLYHDFASREIGTTEVKWLCHFKVPIPDADAPLSTC